MAKKRSIEEVESSSRPDGVQSKKKKTKKVGIDQGVTILRFYGSKLKF